MERWFLSGCLSFRFNFVLKRVEWKELINKEIDKLFTIRDTLLQMKVMLCLAQCNYFSMLRIRGVSAVLCLDSLPCRAAGCLVYIATSSAANYLHDSSEAWCMEFFIILHCSPCGMVVIFLNSNRILWSYVGRFIVSGLDFDGVLWLVS